MECFDTKLTIILFFEQTCNKMYNANGTLNYTKQNADSKRCNKIQNQTNCNKSTSE